MVESAKVSKSWGGARKGAGRKSIDASQKRSILSLYLKPEVINRLKEAAAAYGVTPSVFVSKWVEGPNFPL